jgi:hypothetical protein
MNIHKATCLKNVAVGERNKRVQGKFFNYLQISLIFIKFAYYFQVYFSDEHLSLQQEFSR